MSKFYLRLLIGFIALFGLLLFWESTVPDPVDWRPSYSIKDKIPFGTYIFYESLKEIRPDLELVSQPPFEFTQDPNSQGTYLMIDRTFNFWDGTEKRLLDWVAKGNTLLMSATYSGMFRADTLGLDYQWEESSSKLINHPTFNFYNPELSSAKAYEWGRNSGLAYFSKIDTLNNHVLGWTSFKKTDSTEISKKINFIEVPFGEGKVLLHTSPQVFTNFFLLKDNNLEYVEKLLAYLDLDEPLYYSVYGDPHFRSGGMRTSYLYAILENKYLRKSYYVLLLGVLLFIIFEGKRKQKPIEVRSPLENKSYDFVRTISGLYLDQKNHAAILHKKIEQFLDFLKTELKVDSKNIDTAAIHHIAEMTQNSEEEVRDLMKYIKELQQRREVTREDVKKLNKKINLFKKNI